MLELSIKQVQKQLSGILSETTVIVSDKKHKEKKAVIVPYDDYQKLVHCLDNKNAGKLDKFVGILSDKFKINDKRYNDILK